MDTIAAATSKYYSILHAVLGSIQFNNTEYCIRLRYCSKLHGHYNITQYYMQYRVAFNSIMVLFNAIILNIIFHITQY